VRISEENENMTHPIERLYEDILKHGEDPSRFPRTAKLLAGTRVRLAQKLSEEATEVALEFATGDRDAVVRESADLIYQLVLVWVAARILPDEIGWELDRRRKMMGLAEKLPKSADNQGDQNQTAAAGYG
jgi:phosphoribosyl-ATP pyrophosphohydrolase